MKKDGKGLGYVPDVSETAKPKLMTITDPYAWEAQEVIVVGPMHQAILEEMKAQGIDDPNKEVELKASQFYPKTSACAIPVGEVHPLFEMAAWECFYDIELGVLKQYGHWNGVDYAGHSLFEFKDALLRKVLPGATEAQLIAIHEKNPAAGSDSQIEDLLALDWVLDSFDAETKKVVEDEIKTAQKEKESAKEYDHALMQRRVLM